MRQLHLRLSAIGVVFLATIHASATTTIAIFPTGVTFKPQATGTVSGPQTVTVYNLGSTTVAMTAFTSTISQLVVAGTLPVTLAPAKSVDFTVTFHPDSAKSFSGNLNGTFDIAPMQRVTVTGLGTSLTAVANLNQTSLSFAS